jgi:uncharacterized protein
MPPPKFIADHFHLCKYAAGWAIWQNIFLALKKVVMKIQHKEGENRGVFFIAEEEDILAQLAYAKSSNNTMIIEHTEVDDELRGQNIGYELVHKSVEYARMHGMKVSPVCPFAKAVFDKKPEFGDVLV